jgi:hypothetical protein
VPRYSDDYAARVVIDGESQGETQTTLDIAGTSIRYLEDRIGRLKAAQLAGLATKAALGIGVAKATKNDDLGVLAFYALMASERADLRSWSTLPASLQMLRVPLPAGKHRVNLDILGASGAALRTVDVGEIEVQASKKRFIVVR